MNTGRRIDDAVAALRQAHAERDLAAAQYLEQFDVAFQLATANDDPTALVALRAELPRAAEHQEQVLTALTNAVELITGAPACVHVDNEGDAVMLLDDVIDIILALTRPDPMVVPVARVVDEVGVILSRVAPPSDGYGWMVAAGAGPIEAEIVPLPGFRPATRNEAS